MSSETALSKSITKALQALGCIVIRVQSGVLRFGGRVVRCAPKGTPDLVVLMKGGRTIWLEIKTASGKVSEEQQRTHGHWRSIGHTVAVVKSVAEAVKVVRE